jgi:hypothetical protein
MRFAILCSALLLSGCAGTQVELTKSMEDAAKTEILKAVKDPESIEFGGRFAAGHRLNFTILCGWVNGKNGFGGKTGWTLIGVEFPDNGGDPYFVPRSLSTETQCELAHAMPEPPGVSKDLLTKHGIGALEPEQKNSLGNAPHM